VRACTPQMCRSVANDDFSYTQYQKKEWLSLDGCSCFSLCPGVCMSAWASTCACVLCTHHAKLHVAHSRYCKRAYAEQAILRVGQNRIYTPYMTLYLVISLTKIPYIHRMYIYGAGICDSSYMQTAID